MWWVTNNIAIIMRPTRLAGQDYSRPMYAVPAIPIEFSRYVLPVAVTPDPCALCSSRVPSCEKSDLHYVEVAESSRPVSARTVLCRVCIGHYNSYCVASGFPRARAIRELYKIVTGPRPPRMYRCNSVVHRGMVSRCDHGHCDALMGENSYGYLAAIPRDIRGIVLGYLAGSVSDRDYPDDGMALCDYCRGAYILMY